MFYRKCLDCSCFSYGWAEDQRCASCGSPHTVEAKPEEANTALRVRKLAVSGTTGDETGKAVRSTAESKNRVSLPLAE